MLVLFTESILNCIDYLLNDIYLHAHTLSNNILFCYMSNAGV